MWYRKAQVQSGPQAPAQQNQAQQSQAPAQQTNAAPDQQAPTQPAPVADQNAISFYQTEINNILAKTGKTYSEIITGLNNYKNSINLNNNIDKTTKASAVSLFETYITNLTTQAAGDFTKVYVPAPQNTNTAPTTEPSASDPNNPLTRLMGQPQGSASLPGGTDGLLKADQIKQKTGPTMQSPTPGAPAGPQGAQQGQQQAVPSKTLLDALKAAGITNFVYESMPGNTLPLDDRSFEMVKNNLISSKSLDPKAIATLKSLLAAMGVYLTLDNNVMVFSKQQTEATPKPQATFDTVPYKDEKE